MRSKRKLRALADLIHELRAAGVREFSCSEFEVRFGDEPVVEGRDAPMKPDPEITNHVQAELAEKFPRMPEISTSEATEEVIDQFLHPDDRSDQTPRRWYEMENLFDRKPHFPEKGTFKPTDHPSES